MNFTIMQWFTIYKAGKSYCLVHITDKNKLRDALDKVDELLLILNQHTRFSKGIWNLQSKELPTS